MPDSLKTVGIRFVAEGLPDFVTAMNQAGQSVEGFGEKSEKGLLGQIAIGSMLGNILTGALNSVVTGFKNSVGAIESFGKESIMAAGRVEELHLVADLMGQKAGKTSAEVDQLVMSVRNMGIETGVANKTLIDFTRYNMDMADASKLARVAQDAAVIANTGSSEALERLLYGITTQQTEVLRGLGIQIDMNQAMKDYAKANNLSAQAMTSNQRIQASLNAVLTEGAKISGAYEQAMNSAAKQLGSMSSRIIPDLKNAIGTQLQSAFYQAIKGANNLLILITALFTPVDQLTNEMKAMADQVNLTGGAFVPLLQKVNYALQGMAAAAMDIIPQFVGALINMGDQGGQTLGEIAAQAFEWGANIMYQLSIGILQGAVFVVNAVTAIADIIAGLLGPGSPPAAIPNLPVWGLNAIQWFLKGFLKADFSTLQDLSGPLQSALMSLVSEGGLQKQDAMGMFLSLQGSVMGALKSGKEMSAGLYKKIAAATSEYGTAIAELVKKEISLNIVLRQVEQAEKAVKEAREAETEGAKKANTMIKEYNKALLAGAPAEELAAKRKAIEAEVEGVKAAREKRKENEKILAAANKQAQPLQEQLNMQKLLANQLISYKQGLQQIEQMQAAAAKAAAPKGGGAGAGINKEQLKKDIQDALDNIDFTKIMDNLKAKFGPTLQESLNNLFGGADTSDMEVAGGKNQKTEGAFQQLGETLKGIYGTVSDLIGSDLLPWLSDNADMAGRVAIALLGWRTVGAAIIPLLINIGGAWGVLAGVILLAITAIIVFWPQILGFLTQLWQTIQANLPMVVGLIIALLMPALVGILGPVALIIGAVAALVGIIVNFWPQISAFFVNLGTQLQAIGAAIVAWLTGAIDSVITFFINLTTGAWAFISGFFNSLVTGIQTDINNFLTMAAGWLELLKQAVYVPLSDIYTGLVSRFSSWISLARAKLADLKNTISTSFNAILTTITSLITRFYNIGKNIVEGIKNGFERAWNGFLDLVTKLFNRLPEWVRKLLGMASPSKVFMKIGENIASGLTLGMTKSIPEVKSTTTQVVKATVQPAPTSRQIAERAVQRQNQYNNSVTFNAKVDNGIDLAVLRQIIVQTVQTELNA